MRLKLRRNYLVLVSLASLPTSPETHGCQEDEAEKYKMHKWGKHWTLTEKFPSQRIERSLALSKAKPRGEKEIAEMIMKREKKIIKNEREENEANNFSDAFKIWITYL